MVGAVLIIAAGSGSWFNRTILSHRFLVWLGLISFPLYLLYWPLLSFARIVGSDVPSLVIRIAVVLISIVFAWITYRFIEQPIRLGESKCNVWYLLVGSMFVVENTGYIVYS